MRARRSGQGTVLLVLLIGLLHTASVRAEPEVVALLLSKGLAVLRIDGVQRRLKTGDSSPEGVTLLRADADSAEILIGKRHVQLNVERGIGAVVAGQAMLVRLPPGADGHYFADGQINGNPVRFLVDTGATTIAMNKHTARRLGLPYAVDGVEGRMQTASGIAVAYAITLAEVKVQALRLTRVDAVVVDGDYPSVVLLGQSFLNRLDLKREGAVLELRAR